MLKNINKNLILIGAIIISFLIGGTIVYFGWNCNKKIPGQLLPQQAGEKAVNYINQNKDALTGGLSASLLNVTEENGLYKIKIKIGENEYDSYVTKNGKLLFAVGIDLEPTPTITPSQRENEKSSEIPKRDNPDVKLFVMSYCPYGLQTQKMFLPVYNLLKNKVEMGIYFVDYIMHEKKEIDENLRQFCIQKEQKEKYYDYLSCFVKEGSYENLNIYKTCLKKANINESKLQNCISQTDKEYKITELYNDKSTWLSNRFPQFNVHKDLNEKYGVQGSPTIVINDTLIVTNQNDCPREKNIKCAIISDFNRSPEKFKEVICQAFNSPPAECSQTLSNTAFSPGFGLETGSSSGGGCGQ